MILDRTWNKKEQRLTLSYIDKNGMRQFYSKHLHHIKSYEYDRNGDLETWNGKKCRKIYKDTTNYSPNTFELLEYMYELPEDLNKALHAQYFPKIYTWDIETEYTNSFPYPDKAEFKVTAISLVAWDLSCIVYGLNEMGEEQRERFKQRYLDWIENNEFARQVRGSRTPRVLYQSFKSEEDMLKHWWMNVVPKCAILASWNGYGFDMQYMANRTINLFGKGYASMLFKKASPTNEMTYMKVEHFKEMISIPVPSHSVFLDYMKIVEKYDYVLRPYESYSLDWVSSAAFNAHKVEYDGSLQYLYETDHEWYYYYNAIDSLLVMLIHYKLKSLESPCAVSSVTLVPLQQSFGQVALTTANIFKEFYDDGKKVVYEYRPAPAKEEYEGAFCGCVTRHEHGWGHCLDNETYKDEYYKDPTTGKLRIRSVYLGKPLHVGIHCKFNVCSDFSSLYPSQIITCNFSFENIVNKNVKNVEGMPPEWVKEEMNWTEQELDNFKKDPNYFVSIQGTVYKNDRDYAFKRMQARTKKDRSVYKYLAQKIDAELLTEIDHLIQQKEKENAA